MGSFTSSSLSQIRHYILNVTVHIKALDIGSLVGVGVLLVFGLLSLVYVKDKLSKLPPGPIGLPLVGYLPFLSENVHLDLIELGKKYGDIFSLRLGTETVIVLNGATVIKEAFTKPEFLGRPPYSVLRWLVEFSPFFVQDVHVWKEQRKFVVHMLKDLGLGKSKIEGDIEDEIHHFLDVLKTYKGEPMDVKIPLSPSMSNNICALVFGKRKKNSKYINFHPAYVEYEYDDPDRSLLDMNLEKGSEESGQASLPTFFPWIRYIPFVVKLMKLEEGIVAGKKLKEFFRKKVEEHRKTFNPSKIRDFIDGYLLEMESKKNDPNTSFNDEVLLATVSDLLGAGSETVRTTIVWCVYIMAAYPEVQKRVQMEIYDVLGADKSPEFQDQRRLPYTHAVILEVMRWKTVVALNILRFTTGEATVAGYHIPKNTIVLSNLWAVHHDPKLWEEPDAFKPERFLTTEGTSVIKSTNYMPFSIGKRACPGETMANLEVFLYFSSILQKFQIVFPEGVTPTFDAKLTVTYRLNPFKVRFIERK